MAAPTTTTVLVTGARGVLGSFIARELDREGYLVLRGSRRTERERGFRLVDFDQPETVSAAFAEADVIVNPVVHPALVAERTALREGRVLLSVASLSLSDRLSLVGEQALRGGTGLVVVHAGLNPGLMSLVLASLLERHPEADRVDLAATVAPLQTMGGLAFDYVWPFLTAVPRKPVAILRFPEPVGLRHCIELGTGEEGWLGDLGMEREGHVWLTLIQQPMNALMLATNAIGQMHRFPRWSMAPLQGRSRGEFCQDPKRDWVMVSSRGERISAAHIVGDGDYRVSVAATTVFLRQLADRREAEPDLRGVHGAEHFFRLADIEPELKARGVEIRSMQVSPREEEQ